MKIVCVIVIFVSCSLSSKAGCILEELLLFFGVGAFQNLIPVWKTTEFLKDLQMAESPPLVHDEQLDQIGVIFFLLQIGNYGF